MGQQTTLDVLTELRDKYIEELEMLEALEEEAGMAETHYADELAEWESANSDLVARRNKAKEAHTAYQEKVERRKEAIRDAIKEHYFETGEKFPFGDDNEAFLLQERLDWEYDTDDMVRAVMLQGLRSVMEQFELSAVRAFNKSDLKAMIAQHTKAELADIMVDELSADFSEEMLDIMLQFMRTFLKVDIAKGDFRKFISKNVDKDRTKDGDMVVEIPTEFEWLPMEFIVKPTTVISDKKLLAWAESQKGE